MIYLGEQWDEATPDGEKSEDMGQEIISREELAQMKREHDALMRAKGSQPGLASALLLSFFMLLGLWCCIGGAWMFLRVTGLVGP